MGEERAVFYWDLALVLNLITLLPWLWATARLAGHRVHWWRLALAGLLGSVAAVIWDWAGVGHHLLIALLGTVLLLQIAFGPLRPGRLVRTLVPFLMVGGSAAGLSLIGAGSTSVPPAVVLACFALAAGGAHVVWSEMVARASNSANRWQVRLEVGERSLCLDGLVDTGHQLQAPFTGLPVLLVAPADLTPILGQSLCRRLAGAIADWDQLPAPWAARVRSVPFRTVAGEGILPAFRPDGVWLKRGSAPWQRVEALVGMAAFGVGGQGDYQVLLPPLLMESLQGIMGGRA